MFLSFLFDRSEESIQGEVIVSAETVRANAGRYRSTPSDELLRYVVHGVLHLVGHSDQTPGQGALTSPARTRIPALGVHFPSFSRASGCGDSAGRCINNLRDSLAEWSFPAIA